MAATFYMNKRSIRVEKNLANLLIKAISGEKYGTEENLFCDHEFKKGTKISGKVGKHRL